MRPKGSRNASFDRRRSELLDRIKGRLKRQDSPTLRELASAAGCSVSTLRHYFGLREDILVALFDESHERAQRRLDEIRQAPPDFERSVRSVVEEAWVVLGRRGAARTLMMGMMEALGHPRIGPDYLDKMFDPFILALRDRLATHISRGEMCDVDPRMAALLIASPLLMAAVHQRDLGGSEVLPLDQAAFLDHVTDTFVRAYRLPAEESRTRRGEGAGDPCPTDLAGPGLDRCSGHTRPDERPACAAARPAPSP